MLKNLTLNTAITTKRLLLVSFVLLAIASIAFGQQRPSSTSASSNRSTQQADTAFRSARDLITDGNWPMAVEKFDEYVSKYPNEKNIEAALYWLAYTQQKLARYDQCRSTIDRLLQNYPNTTWKDDARLLLAQMPATTIAYQDLIGSATTRVVTVPAMESAVVYAPIAPGTPIAVAAAPAQELASEPMIVGFGSNE